MALYGPGGKLWAMTERSRAALQRSASGMRIGPSGLAWDGSALTIDFDEIAVPWPQRMRGRIRVQPQGVSRLVTSLDDAGRHRWGPIAPCAQVEVDISQPGQRWSGAGYLDSNDGDEPIQCGFRTWDWSRATLADGRTAVIYDVRQAARPGTPPDAERLIAVCCAPDGSTEAFEAPPRQQLPRSGWRIERGIHSAAGKPPHIQRSLEDTPFYARCTARANWLGEDVLAIHETLHAPRMASLPVRLMLPWRMPRRG